MDFIDRRRVTKLQVSRRPQDEPGARRVPGPRITGWELSGRVFDLASSGRVFDRRRRRAPGRLKMPAGRRRSQGTPRRLGRSLTIDSLLRKGRRKMPAGRRRSQGTTRRLGRSLTVHAARRKMPALPVSFFLLLFSLLPGVSPQRFPVALVSSRAEAEAMFPLPSSLLSVVSCSSSFWLGSGLARDV